MTNNCHNNENFISSLKPGNRNRERVTRSVSRSSYCCSHLSFLFFIRLTFSLHWSLQSDKKRTRHFAPIHCVVTVLPSLSVFFLYHCVRDTDGEVLWHVHLVEKIFLICGQIHFLWSTYKLYLIFSSSYHLSAVKTWLLYIREICY